MAAGVVVFQPGSGVTFFASSTSGIVLGSGAVEYVLSGGSAISTTVSNGGTESVFSGGVASVTAGEAAVGRKTPVRRRPGGPAARCSSAASNSSLVRRHRFSFTTVVEYLVT